MSDVQQILFGSDDTCGIVAIETAGRRATLYKRSGDTVERLEEPFTPWLLTESMLDISASEWLELDGEGYRFLAKFGSWGEFSAARYRLRDIHTSHFSYPSAVKQYLTLSGRTLFKGMTFEDVHRMQIDIETMALSPELPENSIFLISVTDNRGFETLIEGSEKEMLKKLVDVVCERDPDVIEGHNIYGFDLPYLARRAEMHRVKLGFGRDGSAISFGAERNCAVGGISRPFHPAFIYGRHVVDTLLSVQRYDIAKGALASHTLKECSAAFGIAQPDRVIIPHTEIAHEYTENPDRVRKYALQDALETRSLSEIVSPAEFYLTQMVPDTYSSAVTGGTGEKINSLMVREYLHQGKAIPMPQPAKMVPGGYTEIRRSGLIHRVVKCDVESLYPSLMLAEEIQPQADTLNVFLPMLEELRERRFQAKSRVKTCKGRDHAYWDGLQGSFKILINSFYGYLGAPFNFNDYDAAYQVTASGQEIVKKIVSELEATGSKVIEVDTDGVYFQPPEGIDTPEAETAYIDKIGSALPDGINLAHDGRYQVMVSLKVKNYVLLGYGGEKIFRGASLRSRADERFGRQFISKAIDLLIEGKPQAVADLYSGIARNIENGELPVEQFARRERVTEKTFTSSAKKRLAEAAKAARVGEYVNVYDRADGSLGLAEEYAEDEDQSYPLDKLYKFACRLREAFGEDFDVYFPKPSKKTKAEAAGQQTLMFFE